MAKHTNKLVALAVVGACGLGVWKVGSWLLDDESRTGSKHLVNRPWIDHMPTDARDMVGHVVVIDHREGQFGFTGRSSQWRHFIEGFRWQLDGDKLHFLFPQDQVRTSVQVKTWKCKGEAPAPFDLCMRITNANGGSAMVYSREEWEIDPSDVQDSIDELIEDEPALAGTLAGLGDDPNPALLELDEDSSEHWRSVDLLDRL